MPGSTPHTYLYFVNLIAREGGIKSEEDKEKLIRFQKNERHSAEAKQIKLWNLLRNYDNQPEERGKILDELVKDYTDFYFDH